MARKYTYEEFESAANDAGLLGEFSAADLKLAQENPDAGMSILNYKKDYHAATTDEQRAQANQGAEQIRSGYGEYTGGKDGSKFYSTPLSPNSFNADEAPTYTSQYGDTISDLLNQQLNYGSYSYSGTKPTYTNRYDTQIQNLLGKIENREEFSYDPETDPLYSQYRKQYTREGQRATANALAEAAAASGGIPSSYASTAAGQAGNYYAAQMTDKIPELWQLAYQKYMNDQNLLYSDLSAFQGAEQSDYDKYLNELTQYNTDRNFDYGVWSDAYNRIANNLNTVSGLEQQDYNKYLTELAQYNTDRSFNYNQLLDEIDSQTRERNERLDQENLAYERAVLAAQYGDYSQLNALGINTDNVSGVTDWEKQFALAEAIAELTGDTTYLYQLQKSMRA